MQHGIIDYIMPSHRMMVSGTLIYVINKSSKLVKSNIFCYKVMVFYVLPITHIKNHCKPQFNETQFWYLLYSHLPEVICSF